MAGIFGGMEKAAEVGDVGEEGDAVDGGRREEESLGVAGLQGNAGAGAADLESWEGCFAVFFVAEELGERGGGVEL